MRGLGWNWSQFEGGICGLAQLWLWRAKGIAGTFSLSGPDSPAGKKSGELYFTGHLNICSRGRISPFAIYSFVRATFVTLSGLSFLESFYALRELGSYHPFIEKCLKPKQGLYLASA